MYKNCLAVKLEAKQAKFVQFEQKNSGAYEICFIKVVFFSVRLANSYINILMIAGFEPWIYHVGSDLSAHWDTTATQVHVIFWTMPQHWLMI